MSGTLTWVKAQAARWLPRAFHGGRVARKVLLRLLANVRYRRPFWSRANVVTLHRMLDPRRLRPGSLPIVINNYNRVATLRALIAWIRSLPGETSIIILDNASTYPPVREFYRSLRDENLQVVRLGYNSGTEGIADVSRELREFRRYVVTDPDLVPYPDTPSDILARMDALLDKYPNVTHVGASLEIRDIPESYPLREEVLAWESHFWPPKARSLGDDGYDALVDTTFAMYRQGVDVLALRPAMRMARPYTLRHADWYLDPNHLTDEQQYYLKSSAIIASWARKWRQTGKGPTP